MGSQVLRQEGLGMCGEPKGAWEGAGQQCEGNHGGFGRDVMRFTSCWVEDGLRRARVRVGASFIRVMGG